MSNKLTVSPYRNGYQILDANGDRVAAFRDFAKAMRHYAALIEEYDRMTADVERLQTIVDKMSHRRCHRCGHDGYYLLPHVPHSFCEKCHSPDTRLIKKR